MRNFDSFVSSYYNLNLKFNLILILQGGESDADKFQVTITLFREEEYGKMEQKKIFSAQRSYTGKVIIY